MSNILINKIVQGKEKHDKVMSKAACRISKLNAN